MYTFWVWSFIGVCVALRYSRRRSLWGACWPKTPQTLSRRINEVAPNLQEAGVSFTRTKEKRKRELQGKLDPERALDIGRELGVDYVVLGQIDEMSMKRFRATVPIGGYRSYQGLTIVQLFPYKVIDGEPAGDVVREAAEDSKRYGITNPAAYVPLEKEYFLLGQMEWGSEEFHQTLLGKSVSKCLDLLAVGLDSLIQPPAALRVSESKLISIDGIQAYINVGLADSVQNGNKYGVWDKGRELRDPDTDEVLGKALSRRVGVVQIEQVLSDHLSLVRILDGQDAVEEGFGIRAE